MADYGAMGLLSGLGNFAHSFQDGLITYNTIQHQKAQQKMEQALTGLQQNDDGSFSYTPEKQEEIDLKNVQAQRQIKELDPNSPEANAKRQGAKGLLEMVRPGLGQIIPDNATGPDVDNIMQYAKPEVTGMYGMMGQQARAQGMMGMVGVRQQQLGLQQDNQASQAVDKVTNDQQLKNHIQRIQGANRILGQLDDAKSGKIVDTNQLLGDINTEYVNLLTGANNSALGKQERTEYRSMAGDLASVLQRIKGDPQSINSPEILNQLETQVKSLRGNYQDLYAQRANSLQRNYAHNPEATNAQKEQIQKMIQDANQTEQSGNASGLISPQDPQIANYAKQYNMSYQDAQKLLKARGYGG